MISAERGAWNGAGLGDGSGHGGPAGTMARESLPISLGSALQVSGSDCLVGQRSGSTRVVGGQEKRLRSFSREVPTRGEADKGLACFSFAAAERPARLHPTSVTSHQPAPLYPCAVNCLHHTSVLSHPPAPLYPRAVNCLHPTSVLSHPLAPPHPHVASHHITTSTLALLPWRHLHPYIHTLSPTCAPTSMLSLSPWGRLHLHIHTLPPTLGPPAPLDPRPSARLYPHIHALPVALEWPGQRALSLLSSRAGIGGLPDKQILGGAVRAGHVDVQPGLSRGPSVLSKQCGSPVPWDWSGSSLGSAGASVSTGSGQMVGCLSLSFLICEMGTTLSPWGSLERCHWSAGRGAVSWHGTAAPPPNGPCGHLPGPWQPDRLGRWPIQGLAN
ncbi:uncharacterized protein LOC126081186 [Elephas maximus indicus]|uniref:uncharacterized protein LOC126081186 n=1 Tax=Elephas maximus indicus TaxID=99487 RepID=UPI002115D3CC|nr:uncharacterized protein LOC126081186 [Elephas maximus indicus]